MPITNLITNVATDHVHVEEDLTDQVDGYKLTFYTSQVYIPGSLRVVSNGVYYSPINDFIESGPNSFTFLTGLSDDPFPPELDCPLYVIYRRTPAS